MKIQTKLFLFVLALVLVIEITITLISINSLISETNSNVDESLKSNAFLVVNSFTRFMSERISDMETLSSKQNILLNDETVPIVDKIEYLRVIERTYKVYNSFSIYDKNGIKIGDTRNILLGIDESNERFFQKAINGESYHDSSPVLSKSLEKKVIHVSAPLRDLSGNIDGVIVSRFSLDKAVNFLPKISKNIKFDLVAADGSIIFSNYINKNEKIDMSAVANDNQVTENMYDGEESLLAAIPESPYLDFKGSDWIGVSTISKKDAFKELDNLVLLIWISSMAIMGISVVLIKMISNSILGPIKILYNGALRIKNGDYETDIKSGSTDEFKELESVLNQLPLAIKKSIELEKELAIREMDKEIEIKKVQQEKLQTLGLLAANLAHDIKNPLNNLQRFSDIIKKTSDVNTIKTFSPNLDKNIKRISHQVQDVLEYVGFSPLNITNTSILQIIKGSISTLDVPPNIQIKIPNTDHVVNCDTNKIEAVFVNIILNAIQAMNESGIITIQTKSDSDFLNIEIGNDGPPIPENVLPKIFEPLFTTKQAGTGLGLMSSMNIIKQHGGTIQVNPDPVVFTIKLPNVKE